MCSDENGLVVIGAGLMRTGTNSLQMALQRLLDGKCHHMQEVIDHPKDAKFWLAAASKNPTKQEWRAYFSNYKAAVDFPTVAFFKELVEVYPNAKVVLTVRDPERWYESAKGTVIKASIIFATFPMNIIGRLSGTIYINQMIDAVITRVFGATLGHLSKEQMIATYHRHVEEVKRIVPREQLLVFEAKEGWKPLCDFLGLSVPDEPYPHVNTTDQFQGKIKKLKRFSQLSLLGTVLLVAGVGGLAYIGIKIVNIYFPFEMPSFRASEL